MKAIPTTEPARRIGTIFGRNPNALWPEVEIREYKKLVKNHCFESLDDLCLVERYYKAERAKGKDGMHRRDVLRLLRYWQGEVDRAREWNARKIAPRGFTSQKKNGTNGEKPATDEDFKRVGEIARKELARFKEQMKNVPSPGFIVTTPTTMFDSVESPPSQSFRTVQSIMKGET